MIANHFGIIVLDSVLVRQTLFDCCASIQNLCHKNVGNIFVTRVTRIVASVSKDGVFWW